MRLGFIRGVESIPVLLGVPLTAFLNDASHRYGRAGYYICSAVAAISAILMFFIGYPAGNRQNLSKYSGNGSITSHCTMPTSDCPDLLNQSFSSGRYGNWHSNAPFTTMTNGCKASGHQHYTPTHQHQNTGGGGGGAGGRYNTGHCHNGSLPSRGRLQKSLSFAFQSPAMWNDGYVPYYNTTPSHSSRPYSRLVYSRVNI